MTNEIKRLLRCLDEACQEQGLSMADALAWFETSRQQTQQIIEQTNRSTEQNFRKIAENVLSFSCIDNQAHKNICVELLCQAHEAGDNILLTQAVVDHLYEQKLIPTKSFGRKFAKELIYDFMYDYYRMHGIDEPRRIIGKPGNWHSICFSLRNLVKSL